MLSPRLLIDSITAFAYDRATPHQPSVAKLVGDAFQTFLPAMINGGIGGEKTTDALRVCSRRCL